MVSIRDFSVRAKLAVMLLVPMIALMYFALTQTNANYKLYSEQGRLQALIQISSQATLLVHELQKERGMTASFVGSQGKSFSSRLQEQRKVVDAELEKWNAVYLAFDVLGYGGRLGTDLSEIDSKLLDLTQHRSDVSNLRIDTRQAIAFYTHLNGMMLSITEYIPRISSVNLIGVSAAAYTNFLYAKERAGIERAVLAGVF